jgi:hypothetical protein
MFFLYKVFNGAIRQAPAENEEIFILEIWLLLLNIVLLGASHWSHHNETTRFSISRANRAFYTEQRFHFILLSLVSLVFYFESF